MHLLLHFLSPATNQYNNNNNHTILPSKIHEDQSSFYLAQYITITVIVKHTSKIQHIYVETKHISTKQKPYESSGTVTNTACLQVLATMFISPTGQRLLCTGCIVTWSTCLKGWRWLLQSCQMFDI